MKKYLLFTALLLGLAWAIRGHFGHEWGAAWAGGIGGMALVVGSLRRDWLLQIPYLAALAAIGWGVGGMMSYGIVIGYCRGDDFVNVFYGYAMLAVIGGLYGCIGGGFVGLGLETTEDKKPQWASLVTEMIAGGLLAWGLLIYQLEYLMTPPRSELWAACFGAALAMIWYMARNNFKKSLKVALFTMLGSAFGFAFGNFIQGLGIASGMQYNWWNVMEFTLGFSGGVGMAYATVSTKWEQCHRPSDFVQYLSLVFLFLILPLVNYGSAFTKEKITKLAQDLNSSDIETFISFQHGVAWVTMIFFAALAFWMWRHNQHEILKKRGGLFLLTCLALYYTIFALIIKGFFQMTLSLKNSTTLYIPILVFALYLGWSISEPKTESVKATFRQKSWHLVILFIICLVFMTIVSLYVNEPTDRTPRRF